MASHARRKYTVCEHCGEPPTVDNPLSARGKHAECAITRMTEAAVQMRAQEGPYYDQWRKSMAHHFRRLADAYSD